MSGRFNYAGRKSTAFPTMDAITVLVGKSTQIHAGDVLVLTNGSTYSNGTQLVVRPLLSGDTITVSNGLAGVALYDFQTDSSANPTTVSSAVTVDIHGQVQYPLPSIGFAMQTDPVTGYTKTYIASADSSNLFQAQTQTSDVANYYLLNRRVGIAASAASFPANYTVDDDTAAANSPLIVTNVDASDPQFNSANGGGTVTVNVVPTFNAIENGTFFST